jgi:hypothetical protein
VASFVNDQLWAPYVAPVVGLIEGTIGRVHPFVFFPVASCVSAAMLGLPQLAFALIGGLLSSRFKITITRR